MVSTARVTEVFSLILVNLMNLREAIVACYKIEDDDNLVVYVKKIDGKFSPTSEAVLLELSEEELEMPTLEVSIRKCPGFSYALEVFLIKELIEDYETSKPEHEINKIIDRVIHYIEYDA